MSDYLYENEEQYNDAREYYEGSDVDNWEDNEVFNDHEGEDDWGDDVDADIWDDSDADNGWEDDGRWDE